MNDTDEAPKARWYVTQWPSGREGAPSLDARRLLERFVEFVAKGETPPRGVLTLMAQQIAPVLEDRQRPSLDRAFGLKSSKRGRPGEPLARRRQIVRQYFEARPHYPTAIAAARAVAPRDIRGREKMILKWAKNVDFVAAMKRDDERNARIQDRALDLLERYPDMSPGKAWERASQELYPTPEDGPEQVSP